MLLLVRYRSRSHLPFRPKACQWFAERFLRPYLYTACSYFFALEYLEAASEASQLVIGGAAVDGIQKVEVIFLSAYTHALRPYTYTARFLVNRGGMSGSSFGGIAGLHPSCSHW